jgi:hypothetical protein
MAYTLLTGDPRAIGTGNPPGDANNINDVAAGMGGTLNVLNTAYAGGADPTNTADSTAAFQAAITAAVAISGEVIVPPGSYKLNTAGINITGPFRMRGLGAGLANQSNVSTPAPAVVLNCNGNGGGTSLFNFPYQGYLWGGLEVENVSVIYTGTGNVWNLCNFTDALFRNMLTTLTAAGSMAIFTTGSVSYLNVLHDRCNFTTTASVRTSPVISVSSSIAASVSNNTFFKCKWSNQGYDVSQYMVFFSCTSSYHYADNFRECWFERPFGGAFKCLSGQNIIVDGCSVWDIFTGPSTTVAAASNGGTISGVAAWAFPSAGVLAVASTATFQATGQLQVAASGATTAIINYTGITSNTFTGCTYVSGSPVGTVATGGNVTSVLPVGNSTFYFGAAAANPGTQGLQVSNCGRSQAGPNGTSTWDVECESTTSDVIVSTFVNKSASPSVYTPVYLNFHGCNDVTLISNQTPQGAAVNGNSNTVVTNPSPTQALISQGILALPAGSFEPADASFLEWNYDPARVHSSVGPTSGTIQAIRITVRRPITVTNIVLYQQGAGTGLVAGCLVGLYTSAGVQVGVSADQATVWNSGGQVFKTMALTGGPFLLAPGYYFVLAVANQTAGGTPTWGLDQSFGAGLVNANIGALGARWATGAAAQTTLPASFTPTTYLTLSANTIWAGLS